MFDSIVRHQKEFDSYKNMIIDLCVFWIVKMMNIESMQTLTVGASENEKKKIYCQDSYCQAMYYDYKTCLKTIEHVM